MVVEEEAGNESDTQMEIVEKASQSFAQLDTKDDSEPEAEEVKEKNKKLNASQRNRLNNPIRRRLKTRKMQRRPKSIRRRKNNRVHRY